MFSFVYLYASLVQPSFVCTRSFFYLDQTTYFATSLLLKLGFMSIHFAQQFSMVWVHSLNWRISANSIWCICLMTEWWTWIYKIKTDNQDQWLNNFSSLHDAPFFSETELNKSWLWNAKLIIDFLIKVA